MVSKVRSGLFVMNGYERTKLFDTSIAENVARRYRGSLLWQKLSVSSYFNGQYYCLYLQIYSVRNHAQTLNRLMNR